MVASRDAAKAHAVAGAGNDESGSCPLAEAAFDIDLPADYENRLLRRTQNAFVP